MPRRRREVGERSERPRRPRTEGRGRGPLPPVPAGPSRSWGRPCASGGRSSTGPATGGRRTRRQPRGGGLRAGCTPALPRRRRAATESGRAPSLPPAASQQATPPRRTGTRHWGRPRVGLRREGAPGAPFLGAVRIWASVSQAVHPAAGPRRAGAGARHGLAMDKTQHPLLANFGDHALHREGVQLRSHHRGAAP